MHACIATLIVTLSLKHMKLSHESGVAIAIYVTAWACKNWA